MCLAGELAGSSSEEAQVGDRAWDLHVARQHQRLAAVAGFDFGDAVEPGFQRVRQAVHPASAFVAGQRGPGRLGGTSGRDGGIHGIGVAIGAARHRVANSRIENVDVVRAHHGLAADQMADQAQCRGAGVGVSHGRQG